MNNTHGYKRKGIISPKRQHRREGREENKRNKRKMVTQTMSLKNGKK